MQDRSYGIVPLAKKSQNSEIYLVKMQKGHWSLPKGHAERGEGEREAASRELCEETGLEVVDWIDLAPIEEEYSFTERGIDYEKRVVYFFALVNGVVILQEEEVAEGRWVTLDEAEELMTFPEGKGVIREAKRRLAVWE